MKPDVYTTVYITFAASAAGMLLGWMPALLFGMTAIFAFGAFIHQWRARIARRRTDSLDEEASIALFSPELIDKGDALSQACYVLQEIECFKAKHGPEKSGILDARLAAAIEAYKRGHDGGNPKPWVHIAVLRQYEKDIENAKGSSSTDPGVRSSAFGPETGPVGEQSGKSEFTHRDPNNPTESHDRRRKPSSGRTVPTRREPGSSTGGSRRDR
jgi:hypothetical protein